MHAIIDKPDAARGAERRPPTGARWRRAGRSGCSSASCSGQVGIIPTSFPEGEPMLEVDRDAGKRRSTRRRPRERRSTAAARRRTRSSEIRARDAQGDGLPPAADAAGGGVRGFWSTQVAPIASAGGTRLIELRLGQRLARRGARRRWSAGSSCGSRGSSARSASAASRWAWATCT